MFLERRWKLWKSLRRRGRQRRRQWRQTTDKAHSSLRLRWAKKAYDLPITKKKKSFYLSSQKKPFKKHKIQVKDENDFFSATQNHAENECICVPVTTILSTALVFRHIHWGMSMFRSDSSLVKIFSCLQTFAKRGLHIKRSSRAFQQVNPNYTQKPFILESEDRCIITLIRAVLLTAIYLSIFLSVIFFHSVSSFFFILSSVLYLFLRFLQ